MHSCVVWSRALREELYRAFLTRASDGDTDNTPLIAQVMRIQVGADLPADMAADVAVPLLDPGLQAAIL